MLSQKVLLRGEVEELQRQWWVCVEKRKWGNDGVVERELLVDEAGAVHVVDDAGGRGAEGIALVVEIDDEVIDRVLGGVNKRNQREGKQMNE